MDTIAPVEILGQLYSMKANKKAEIIEVANKLFSQKGYNATTMNDLLNELNIAKGTLYHHFKSKEEILKDVLTNMINNDITSKNKLLDTPEFKSLTAIEKLLTLLNSSQLEHENQSLVNDLNDASNAYMHSQHLGLYISLLAPIFTKIVKEGCEEGLFTTHTPEESVELLLGGLQYITDIGFYNWSEERLIARKKAMPHLIEQVLGAKKGSISQYFSRPPSNE